MLLYSIWLSPVIALVLWAWRSADNFVDVSCAFEYYFAIVSMRLLWSPLRRLFAYLAVEWIIQILTSCDILLIKFHNWLHVLDRYLRIRCACAWTLDGTRSLGLHWSLIWGMMLLLNLNWWLTDWGLSGPTAIPFNFLPTCCLHVCIAFFLRNHVSLCWLFWLSGVGVF